jgi:AcrR family transcriptional regulator
MTDGDPAHGAADGSAAPDGVDGDVLTRTERKRRQRARVFVEGAKHIIATDGFEGLTISRLARELDSADSAVYRYFASKGALIAEIQREAIERLSLSLTTITRLGDERFAAAGLDGLATATARLVLFGRWFCATTETYPEELRLLQMIMSQRASALDPEGGARILPIAMELLGHAVIAIEAAQQAGAISPGNSIDRAALWSSALSGVIETDDLEKYVPELFGGTRLARQANLDLLAGWGADRALLAAATELVDGIAADGPVAP